VKKIALILGIALLVAGSASAQSVVGSAHDMTTISGGPGTSAYGGQVCVYCHTPHRATSGAALWNRTLPAASSFTGAEGVMTYINVGASATCLSCHDGTVGVDNVINVGGVAGAWTDAAAASTDFTADWRMNTTNPAYVGTDLSNDHPIGVDYPVALGATSTRFKSPVTNRTGVLGLTVGATTTKLNIYERTGTTAFTVECSSCHTPHDNSKGFFLRALNTSSQVCLACHTK
jgi:predicted CXXCH cytochrome family protein